jgi:TRAP-type mannitol/chloroaromatic compound transport system permease small subunit
MKDKFSLFGGLTALMNAAGTCLVLFIMAAILTDVLGRMLFNKPLAGTPEMVAMSIAAIVFLQFPSTLRAGRVIFTDGFLGWVGKRSIRWEQWLLSVYHVIGGIMFSIVCAYVWPLLAAVWENGDYYGTLSQFTFPKWPVFAVIEFGCGVMALQYWILAVDYARAGWRNERLVEIDPATRVLS